MKIKTNILAKKEDNKSVLTSILNSRGINPSEYLHPNKKSFLSPYSFADMKKAVDIIKNAIKNNDEILIWGDFDADGVTSTSILYKALTALDAKFSYFMPERLTMGHGINLKELLKRKAKNNVKVLITVDCGISNLKEIALMKSFGVKTIVTDHHEPPEVLPDADCILNPLADNSLDENLSAKDIQNISYLSGAGVAMELAIALLGEDYNNVKDEIIALAAIGTISDVAPLLGENRVIAAHGLEKINEGKLVGVSRLFENENILRQIKSDDIAFVLAPRINSAGRLDSPFQSIKLLIEDSEFALDMTIEKLNSLNKIRQSLCETVFEEALGMLCAPAGVIVLFNDSWHIGIIGIVASRLVDRFNLPVFLITKDENEMYRCSIRAPKEYEISSILKTLKDCFVGFGGHSAAGGFTADSREITFDTLKKRIEEVISDYSGQIEVQNTVDVDIELDAEDLTFDLIEDIDKMEPFGAENKKPVFLFKDARVLEQRTIGKEANHLLFSISKEDREFPCLFWGRKILGINNGELLDLVFKAEINTYNEEKRIQLITECILDDPLTEKYYRPVKIFDHRQKTGILPKIDEYVGAKNGDVKIWAQTVDAKKRLGKFANIKNNLMQGVTHEKSIMLFDYPPCLEEFRELIQNVAPVGIHIMKSDFSKNPDDYVSIVCGMIKFASNNRNGEIDICKLALNSGLDEPCIRMLLDLLEKLNSIRIDDIDKIKFLQAPSSDMLHGDELYSLFKNEFDRVIKFKEFIQTAKIDDIEKLCEA